MEVKNVLKNLGKIGEEDPLNRWRGKVAVGELQELFPLAGQSGLARRVRASRTSPAMMRARQSRQGELARPVWGDKSGLAGQSGPGRMSPAGRKTPQRRLTLETQ